MNVDEILLDDIEDLRALEVALDKVIDQIVADERAIRDAGRPMGHVSQAQMARLRNRVADGRAQMNRLKRIRIALMERIDDFHTAETPPPSPREMKGRGVGDFLRQVFTGRDQLDRKSQSVLDKNGSSNIKEVWVMRKPIQAFLTKFLNIVTLGKFDKEMLKNGHDKLFHLSAVVLLENGNRYRLEKNETVKISRTGPFSKEDDVQPVKFTGMLTLLDAFNRTIAGYPNAKMAYGYDSLTNNCQRFVSMFLKRNKEIRQTSANMAFINQNLTFIVKNFPAVGPFAKILTDLRNKLGVIQTGGKSEGHSTNTLVKNKIYDNNIDMNGKGKRKTKSHFVGSPSIGETGSQVANKAKKDKTFIETKMGNMPGVEVVNAKKGHEADVEPVKSSGKRVSKPPPTLSGAPLKEAPKADVKRVEYASPEDIPSGELSKVEKGAIAGLIVVVIAGTVWGGVKLAKYFNNKSKRKLSGREHPPRLKKKYPGKNINQINGQFNKAFKKDEAKAVKDFAPYIQYLKSKRTAGVKMGKWRTTLQKAGVKGAGEDQDGGSARDDGVNRRGAPLPRNWFDLSGAQKAEWMKKHTASRHPGSRQYGGCDDKEGSGPTTNEVANKKLNMLRKLVRQLMAKRDKLIDRENTNKRRHRSIKGKRGVNLSLNRDMKDIDKQIRDIEIQISNAENSKNTVDREQHQVLPGIAEGKQQDTFEDQDGGLINPTLAVGPIGMAFHKRIRQHRKGQVGGHSRQSLLNGSVGRLRLPRSSLGVNAVSLTKSGRFGANLMNLRNGQFVQ